MKSGQALMGIFKLNQYLYQFAVLSPKYKFDLFDRLIMSILCYGAHVTGFSNLVQQERIHLQFYKKLLGVKSFIEK